VSDCEAPAGLFVRSTHTGKWKLHVAVLTWSYRTLYSYEQLEFLENDWNLSGVLNATVAFKIFAPTVSCGLSFELCSP
jgi:hypothetical protein